MLRNPSNVMNPNFPANTSEFMWSRTFFLQVKKNPCQPLHPATDFCLALIYGQVLISRHGYTVPCNHALSHSRQGGSRLKPYIINQSGDKDTQWEFNRYKKSSKTYTTKPSQNHCLSIKKIRMCDIQKLQRPNVERAIDKNI